MNKRLRNRSVVFAAIIALCALFAGSVVYVTEFKENAVCTYLFDDKDYYLEMYQIGEPTFPFGETKCRLILKKDDEEISHLDFSIHNDGASVRVEENIAVRWNEDNVTVVACGEEQERETYILFFDGRIEQ